MNPTFKKLNFKNQERILVLNSPETFRENILEMQLITSIDFTVNPTIKYSFCLIFVKSKAELAEAVATIHGHLNENDPLLWIAYPKKTSKKYTADLTRDEGWEVTASLGVEGVSMVAIDQDWSALRLRKVGFIKTLKRKFGALSEAGKKRVEQNKKQG